MAYGDYSKLSETARESTKRNKDYAKRAATSKVDNIINDFKRVYADKAVLIKRKSEKPFETEFGYIPLNIREDYEESHVSKKSGTGYYTSYSATVSSSGDVSIDPHTDSVDYKYYAIDSEKSSVEESVCFKLVKKGSTNIVKQKEAEFIKAYSNYSSAYHGIDHKTKTVIKPTKKNKADGKRVRISCIINFLLSLYMVFWSIVNLINNYYWWENGFSNYKRVPVGTFVFCFLAFFSIIINLKTISHLKKVYIDPKYCGGIEDRNELCSYYRRMCIYFIFSICTIIVAIFGLYYLDMLLTLILIPLSVVKVFKSIKRTSRNEVNFINSCVSVTFTSEELLSSPSYEKMVEELKEIQEYNMISLEEEEEWWYDYESIMRGEMSVKQFARLHPEFIVGNDPIDPDDPASDYLD